MPDARPFRLADGHASVPGPFKSRQPSVSHGTLPQRDGAKLFRPCLNRVSSGFWCNVLHYVWMLLGHWGTKCLLDTLEPVTARLLPRGFGFDASDEQLVVNKAVEEVVPFLG
jgi:hypothetical protein